MVHYINTLERARAMLAEWACEERTDRGTGFGQDIHGAGIGLHASGGHFHRVCATRPGSQR